MGAGVDEGIGSDAGEGTGAGSGVGEGTGSGVGGYPAVSGDFWGLRGCEQSPGTGAAWARGAGGALGHSCENVTWILWYPCDPQDSL